MKELIKTLEQIESDLVCASFPESPCVWTYEDHESASELILELLHNTQRARRMAIRQYYGIPEKDKPGNSVVEQVFLDENGEVLGHLWACDATACLCSGHWTSGVNNEDDPRIHDRVNVL